MSRKGGILNYRRNETKLKRLKEMKDPAKIAVDPGPRPRPVRRVELDEFGQRVISPQEVLRRLLNR